VTEVDTGLQELLHCDFGQTAPSGCSPGRLATGAGGCGRADCREPPYSSAIDTDELREIAAAAGAAGFGVAAAGPFLAARATLIAHKASAMSGPLRFTYDEPAAACDVTSSFPWARSIIAFSHNYVADAPGPAAEGAVVGRFATRDHYEPVRAVARSLCERLTAAGRRSATLIDDNRLVDRAAAARSGVGWTGKSTMVLSPGHGPWLLLGSVVTDAALAATGPLRRDCGACDACARACPTGAIGPGGLDARRCVAAWLQAPGAIPRWIRPHVGRRVYGCDDCLASCPPGARALQAAPADPLNLPFADLLGLTDAQLLDRFAWWYVPRRDGRFIRRNLLVAAANSGEDGAAAAIEEHLRHRSSLIRGHAAWATARSLGAGARDILLAALEAETVKAPIEELEHALLMVEAPRRPGVRRSDGR